MTCTRPAPSRRRSPAGRVRAAAPRLAALALLAAATAMAAPTPAAPAGVTPADRPAATAAAAVASAPGTLAPGDAEAQCESAVGRAIREARGKAVQGGILFSSGWQAAHTGAGRTEVRGDGRYRRAGVGDVAFRYRCLVDESGATEPGVVFHETGREAPEHRALPVWQADLSRLSPPDCERAVAALLQSRNPRAGGIVFEGETRQLAPAADDGSTLSGRGHLTRASGLPASPFAYACVFDAAGHLAHATAGDVPAHP